MDIEKELSFCSDVESLLLENVGRNHIIIRYRNALFELKKSKENWDKLKERISALEPHDMLLVMELTGMMAEIEKESESD